MKWLNKGTWVLLCWFIVCVCVLEIVCIPKLCAIVEWWNMINAAQLLISSLFFFFLHPFGTRVVWNSSSFFSLCWFWWMFFILLLLKYFNYLFVCLKKKICGNQFDGILDDFQQYCHERGVNNYLAVLNIRLRGHELHHVAFDRDVGVYLSSNRTTDCCIELHLVECINRTTASCFSKLNNV